MRFHSLSYGNMNSRAPFLLTSLVLAVAACGTDTVVHGVSEREANLIVEVLSDKGITANKVMNNTGREVVYDLAVPASSRLEAIKALNERELPRRRDKGYGEIFAEGGIIPTSSEEKAKRLAALEGEIERQLKLVDGVLDVEVQIVMPDESALRTTKEQEPPTTASVTMKYLPRADDSRPISEPEVQAVVAAGVEKLMPENVVVLMRKVGTPPKVEQSQSLFSLPGRVSPKVMSGIVIVVGVLVAALIVFVIFSQWQLRTVRGRLVRLQSEIAKARKKSSEALQPPAESA